MPTYSYACTECDNRFDAVQAFTDDALTTCPKCSGRLRKLFGSVGVVFKGSGFYRNDSRDVREEHQQRLGQWQRVAESTPRRRRSRPTSPPRSRSPVDREVVELVVRQLGQVELDLIVEFDAPPPPSSGYPQARTRPLPQRASAA